MYYFVTHGNAFSLFSSDLFLGEGLNHLAMIIQEKCYKAAFRIVANVVPLFFTSAGRLLQEQR